MNIEAAVGIAGLALVLIPWGLEKLGLKMPKWVYWSAVGVGVVLLGVAVIGPFSSSKPDAGSAELRSKGDNNCVVGGNNNQVNCAPSTPAPQAPSDSSDSQALADTHGWLVPANEPSARTVCPERPVGVESLFPRLLDEAKTLVVALGDSGVMIPYFVGRTDNTDDQALAASVDATPRRILRISACHVLTIQRTTSGLSIDADVYGTSGFMVAQIRNNEFSLAPSQAASWKRDRSSLTVTGHNGEELFWIRYLNPRSVQVRGYFSCEGSDTFHVAQDKMEVVGGGPTIERACHDIALPPKNDDDAAIVIGD